MRLIITDQGGAWAAKYIKECINKNDTKNEKTVLGLPTGSSPIKMYESLVAMHKAKEVSFKNVVSFNMDEYVGLAKDHPQSYNHFMAHHFFNHIDIDKDNIHIPNGVAPDLERECADYEAAMAKYGKFDIFVGGAGEDGHLAFNEPYSSLSSRTRVKNLSISTIEANARMFKNKSEVPSEAITVGIDTIMAAKEVLILISGYKKARTLYALIEEGISSKFPISVLQLHPKAIIIADEEACAELRVKTYRYFKDIEDEFSGFLDK